MTWDPYDLPHAPGERHDHRLPEEPVKGRAVAGVLVAIVLLAIIFVIAANAQEATTQTGDENAGQQAQEQQEPTGVTGSMQAQPEAQAPEAQAPEAQAPEQQAPEQQAEAQPLDGQIVEQAEGTYAASELIGQSVMTADGEQMGKIADLLVGEDNRIAGAIIGIGGFLGFGEKRIAVEIDRLARAPGPERGEQLALNYTRDQLEQAPEFVTLAEQRRRLEAEQARQQDTGAGDTGQQTGESQSLTQ